MGKMAVTEAAWRGSTPHASPSNLCPLRPPHRHKYARIIHVHTCIYIYVRIAYIHIHTHMHTHTHTHTTSCGCVGRPNHVSLLRSDWHEWSCLQNMHCGWLFAICSICLRATETNARNECPHLAKCLDQNTTAEDILRMCETQQLHERVHM